MKTKTVFKYVALAALTGLAGLAIYDHRESICKAGRKAGEWAKDRFGGKAEEKTNEEAPVEDEPTCEGCPCNTEEQPTDNNNTYGRGDRRPWRNNNRGRYNNNN